MTRLTFLTLAATLAAGSVGATTIISNHGSNTLRIHQSPLGTVMHDGIGTHYWAPMREDRAPLVLRHPAPGHTETRNLGVFARLFAFLNPFDGFHRQRPVAPASREGFAQMQSQRALAVFDDVPGENRAVDMMRTILHRMDR